MAKINITTEVTLNTNHSTLNMTRRPLKRIMAKLYRESKAFPCNEFSFNLTADNYHVQHHFEELNGDVEVTEEIFYQHHGNQPLIFFTMGLFNGRSGWNGLLHYTAPDSKEIREYVSRRAEVIDVVVAYADPFTNLYHVIVDTHADDLSEENFYKIRKQVFKGLSKNIDELKPCHFNFYVRALPIECYDILDRDALFGPEEPLFNDNDNVNDNFGFNDNEFRSCETMSVGEVIKTFFGRVFKTTQH